VLQGHAGLIGIAKTNEWGEFRFEFKICAGRLAGENYWVSVGLPDSKSVIGGTTEEPQIPGDTRRLRKTCIPRGRREGEL